MRSASLPSRGRSHLSRPPLSIVLSIALAALVHHTLERPLLRARARRLARPADGVAAKPASSR